MLSKKLLSAVQSGPGGGGSGISFVGFANGIETSSSTGISPYVSFGSSAISGVQSGDLLVVFISDDVSMYGNQSVTGWTEAYWGYGMSGSSFVNCWTKFTTSSDTSFSLNTSRVGTTSTFVCPSSVMVAFRNVSSRSVYADISDRDDPPYAGPWTAGEASLIALHYQDDNSRSSPSVSGYTACGNCFRYISSNTSSGTLVWYNLNPSIPYEDVSDISGSGTPSRDLGAATLRLTP